MHQILKSIVTAALAAPECRELVRFVNLKQEIITHATVTLEKLLAEANATVRVLVDMEASYLSANFFRRVMQLMAAVFTRSFTVFTRLLAWLRLLLQHPRHPTSALTSSGAPFVRCCCL